MKGVRCQLIKGLAHFAKFVIDGSEQSFKWGDITFLGSEISWVGSLKTETWFFKTMVLVVSMLRLRMRLFFPWSQCQDWYKDFFLHSLNIETETETQFLLVSVSRLPNVKTETKIKDGLYIWKCLRNSKMVTKIEIDLTN